MEKSSGVRDILFVFCYTHGMVCPFVFLLHAPWSVKMNNVSTFGKDKRRNMAITLLLNFCLFVLLLYVPSQQLWSLRDGQLT